jgi:hypothetical protein
MNGGLKNGCAYKGLRRLKCERRGIPSAITIKVKEEELENDEMHFTEQNKEHSRHKLFSSTGLSVSD